MFTASALGLRPLTMLCFKLIILLHVHVYNYVVVQMKINLYLSPALRLFTIACGTYSDVAVYDNRPTAHATAIRQITAYGITGSKDIF